MTILVAEDDADDRFLIQTAFEEKGYTDKLDFVEDGIELLSYLRDNEKQSTPRIILLDLNMPKKDGREVLYELKQHHLFKRIPIVVFTTTKNEKEIARCYDLGANTYIVKPTTFDELLFIVEQIHSYWLNAASVS
ncbi:MAG TPA: response regulator [Parafilimonas sp.]|jgi:two-component system response regulator